ncbi:MAG: hypothetical protein KF701_00030 [Anaerolineales bacterium]|nr:MAG: hypothetical protein KF701_00030 [Anaerolineales bacterium]
MQNTRQARADIFLVVCHTPTYKTNNIFAGIGWQRQLPLAQALGETWGLLRLAFASLAKTGRCAAKRRTYPHLMIVSFCTYAPQAHYVHSEISSPLFPGRTRMGAVWV